MLTERRSLVSSAVDDDAVRCTECHREVDEFTAIAERSRYWSDGCGELLPFCPECSKREFRARRSRERCIAYRSESRRQ
jgi:hypothetical protein